MAIFNSVPDEAERLASIFVKGFEAEQPTQPEAEQPTQPTPEAEQPMQPEAEQPTQTAPEAEQPAPPATTKKVMKARKQPHGFKDCAVTDGYV